MSILNLGIPTDNLYKFLAVAGLCCFVESLSFGMFFNYKFAFSVHELSLKRDLLDVQIFHAEDKSLQKDALMVEYNNLQSFIELQVENFLPIVFSLFSLALFGQVVASVGFYLWYHKTQIFEDKRSAKDLVKKSKNTE